MQSVSIVWTFDTTNKRKANLICVYISDFCFLHDKREAETHEKCLHIHEIVYPVLSEFHYLVCFCLLLSTYLYIALQVAAKLIK